MSADVEYDIRQVGERATLTLVGTDAVIGVVSGRGSSWVAAAVDYLELGETASRSEAAELVLSDWRRRFDGAPVCSPTSPMALARELHRRRGHLSPVRRQREWLCDCNEDASALNATQWLKDVVHTLGGTFPESRRG